VAIEGEIIMNRLEKFLGDLKSQTPPPCDPQVKGRILHRAKTALINAQNTSTPEKTSHWIPSWVIPFSVGVTVCALFFFWGTPRTETISLTEHRRIMKEMEALFHDQLTAVIEESGKTEVRLTNSSLTPAPKTQRIMIVLSKEGSKINILSYSGQQIEVLLNGAKTILEPLVTGSGEIMILNGETLWKSTQPKSIQSYQVTATPLETGTL
jgi:hypothetical protein